MRYEIHGENQVNFYENAEELTEEFTFKTQVCAERWNSTEHSLETRTDNVEWLGFSSYSKLKDAIKHGWPEALNKTRGLNIEGLPQIKGIVRRKKRADFGDEIDIQSVYSGDLDTAWTSFEHVVSENTGYNNITIIVNMSTFWDVDASRAFWKGATAAILCDNLTRMGKSVEVIASDYGVRTCSSATVPHNYNVIPVKEFDYPMDAEHLHAVLSPGFLRGFVFKAIIKSADNVRAIPAGNMGVPAEPPEKLLNKVFPGRRLIMVPSTIQDSGACETFLKNTLTNLIMRG